MLPMHSFRPRASAPALLALLALPVIAAPRAAQAAANAADKAASEALYEQGKELLRAGKVADACPKFAASQDLDPGVGTLLHLADCYERTGRVASAWAAFLEAASYAKSSGEADREKTAVKRAKALEPKLPHLLIDASAAASAGLEVRRDGKALPEATLGVPIPLDPGDHTVEASAAGKTPFSTTIHLAEGEAKTVQLPALASAAPVEPAPAIAPVVPPAPPPAAPPTAVVETPAVAPLTPPPAPAPTRQSSQRTAAIVVGAVGIATIGVGSYFGSRAISKWSDSKTHCADRECDAEGVALHDQAHSAGNVSTALFAIGGAALATGAVLWFTAKPRAPEVGVAFTPGGATLALKAVLQ